MLKAINRLLQGPSGKRNSIMLITSGVVAVLLSMLLRARTSNRTKAIKQKADDKIASYLRAYLKSKSIAGYSVALFTKSGVEWSHCEGNRDIERGLPIDPDTIFRIYSMTKPITAFCALQLIDQKRLSLDDPVSRYIPAFGRPMRVYKSGDDADSVETEPLETPITIRHLMTHQSGLTYGIFGNHPCDVLLRRAFGEKNSKEWCNSITMHEVCDLLVQVPLCFQPGSAWHYGWSTDVLGHVVEIVSGMPLDKYMDEYLFRPLGMSDTGFYVPSNATDRFASCYTKGHYDHATLFDDAQKSQFTRCSVLLSGGGGLVSTLGDYTRFSRMLMNDGELDGRRVISKGKCDMLFQNHITENKTIASHTFSQDAFSETLGEGIGMGLGISTIVNPQTATAGQLSGIGEGGWGGVASTWFYVDRKKDVGLVFMTQLFPSSTYPLLRSHLRYLSHEVMEEASSILA